jgi:raffinose/stachyose/melibiose transport system permease protein
MEKMLRDKRVIALFVLPAFLIFTVFIPAPLISSLVLSLFRWNLLSPPRFYGIRNFIRLFTLDDIFRKSVGNTFYYLGVSILMQIPLAYVLAIILTRGQWGDKGFRNLIYMPVTISGTAVSLMFYFIFHPETGIINNFIRLFGQKDFNHAWLFEENTAMFAICIAVAWHYVGYHMVIYISGITGISQELIEAAKIDGANAFQVGLHVITPLMKPVINVSLVLITTSSLKAFDSVYVMTQGGPFHATEVMASHMYDRAFRNLDYGYGCAIGLMLFLLCIICSLFWSKIFGTKEGEEFAE